MKDKIPELSPSDLRDLVDISDCPLFIAKEVMTAQSPMTVTVKEIILMIDKLTDTKAQVEEAQKALTQRLNEFLGRP